MMRNERDWKWALEIARDAVGRSSAQIVAEAMDTSPPSLGRWLHGQSEPTGANRRKLIDWAEAQGNPAPKAVRETPATPYRADTIAERDVNGVLIAVEAMSETIAALVRAARAARPGGETAAESRKDQVIAAGVAAANSRGAETAPVRSLASGAPPSRRVEGAK